MLKHVLALSIISFCHSTPSLVGNYSHLILVQHSPITSFFAPLGKVNTSAVEFLAYLSEHWMIFRAARWIVQGLWTVDSNGEHITECVTAYGTRPSYDHNNLNEQFVQELKVNWPVLTLNETEEILWQREYNRYGCCVSIYEATYLEGASILLELYNVGSILNRFRIVPGEIYDLTDIVMAITSTLRKRVYVKCIPAQNPEQQYLLEVQLCFNTFHRLVNCYPVDIDECDANKAVIYPGMPRHSF